MSSFISNKKYLSCEPVWPLQQVVAILYAAELYMQAFLPILNFSLSGKHKVKIIYSLWHVSWIVLSRMTCKAAANGKLTWGSFCRPRFSIDTIFATKTPLLRMRDADPVGIVPDLAAGCWERCEKAGTIFEHKIHMPWTHSAMHCLYLVKKGVPYFCIVCKPLKIELLMNSG